jgi:hypothetical protein
MIVAKISHLDKELLPVGFAVTEVVITAEKE